MRNLNRQIVLALSDREENKKFKSDLKRKLDGVYFAASAKEAADILMTDSCKLLVFELDFDGFDFLSFFKSKSDTGALLSKKIIAIDYCSKEGDFENQIKYIDAGVSYYITFNMIDFDVFVHYCNYLISVVNEHERLIKRYDELILESMQAIVRTIDAKDIYTKGHSIRVGNYASAIAKELGLDEDKVEDIYMIGLLHDVGKIGVPDYILNKPDKLSSVEFDIIKQHTVIGKNILSEMPIVDGIVDGAFHHHERYDGKGYPESLKGEEIPYIARILAVADAYDAMNSDRVYRRRLSPEIIRAEIVKGRSTQFDPDVADAMLRIIDTEIKDINDKFSGHNSRLISDENTALINKIYNLGMQLEASQSIDAITGLMHSDKFIESLDYYLSSKDASGTFMLVDIGSLKKINYGFGHITGDKIIKSMSRIVLQTVKENDFCTRLSGDVFAVFYSGKDSEEFAHRVAQRIIRLFKKRFEKTEYDEFIHLDIGICFAKRDGKTFAELSENSRNALYYAKVNGSNSYHIFINSCQSFYQNSSTAIDMKELKNNIEKAIISGGAYSVEAHDFKMIYNYISRYISRNGNNAQIILYTFTPRDEKNVDMSMLEENLILLRKCIVRSLRKVDVTTRYSSSQQIVILMDTDAENCEIIAKRVMTNFYKSCKYDGFDMHFDIQTIEVSK